MGGYDLMDREGVLYRQALTRLLSLLLEQRPQTLEVEEEDAEAAAEPHMAARGNQDKEVPIEKTCPDSTAA